MTGDSHNLPPRIEDTLEARYTAVYTEAVQLIDEHFARYTEMGIPDEVLGDAELKFHLVEPLDHMATGDITLSKGRGYQLRYDALPYDPHAKSINKSVNLREDGGK